MNNLDLRVVKTRKNLYTALLELMKEKTFEEIKVLDICNHALINRSTFYAHYNDKYELLADLIEDLKNSLASELKKNKNISNTREYYLEMIKLFLAHIKENKEAYLAILIKNRNSITMDMIYDVLEQDITIHLQEDKDLAKIPARIISKFYLGAVVNVGMDWIRQNNSYTKEEMISYLSLLIPEKIA